MSKSKAQEILERFSNDMSLHHDVHDLETILEIIKVALKEGGSLGYSEEDLRQAFYKGREQGCLPDEKATTLFIRPTFNGYLRELEGNEDPHENWKIRVESLINNKDYDLDTWKTMNFLRKFQKEQKEKE
jgi:hypothetical protein